LLKALAHEVLASGFYDAGAGRQTLGVEVGVLHARLVFLEVVDFGSGVFGRVGVLGQEASSFFHDRFDVALVQAVPPPVFVLVQALEIAVKKELAQLDQVLAGVVEIDDVDSTGEVGLDDVPDPFAAIGDDDDTPGVEQSAPDRLGVDASLKLFGRLDGADEAGGGRIANGPAFFGKAGLGEGPAELGLARFGRTVLLFALTVFPLARRHRHARAVTPTA